MTSRGTQMNNTPVWEPEDHLISWIDQPKTPSLPLVTPAMSSPTPQKQHTNNPISGRIKVREKVIFNVIGYRGKILYLLMYRSKY